MPRSLLAALLLALPACDGAADDTADTDADTDVDTDADADAVPWDWCPDAAAYVGDAGWAGSLEVTADALYCGTFSESRTLEQELRLKAMLRVIEGDFAVPVDQGAWPLTLPLCVKRPDAADRPLLAGDGAVVASTWEHGGTTWVSLEADQPMETDAGDRWTLTTRISASGPTGTPPDPVVLDGTTGGTGWMEHFWSALYEGETKGHPEFDTDTVHFTPCADPAYTENVHSVAFEGGEVVLTLQIGQSMASTEPGAFVRAEGTLDGTAFAQSSYWSLVYRPDHHHFLRHFAVLFDAPIGGACALRVEDVDPWQEAPPATVHTAGCDLEPIEEREVTSESLVLE